MPLSVTATLLICAWVGRGESQRRSEPKKLPLFLPCRGRGVCSTHSSWEGSVIRGGSQHRLNLDSAALSHSAGAGEVTKALADCCCSVSGGLSAHCKVGAQMPITEHCVPSSDYNQRYNPPWIWQRSFWLLINAFQESIFSGISKNASFYSYVKDKKWWMDVSLSLSRCKLLTVT